jgi:hypothetical protein
VSANLLRWALVPAAPQSLRIRNPRRRFIGGVNDSGFSLDQFKVVPRLTVRLPQAVSLLDCRSTIPELPEQDTPVFPAFFILLEASNYSDRTLRANCLHPLIMAVTCRTARSGAPRVS